MRLVTVVEKNPAYWPLRVTSPLTLGHLVHWRLTPGMKQVVTQTNFLINAHSSLLLADTGGLKIILNVILMRRIINNIWLIMRRGIIHEYLRENCDEQKDGQFLHDVEVFAL